jgi:hypothetical protein
MYGRDSKNCLYCCEMRRWQRARMQTAYGLTLRTKRTHMVLGRRSRCLPSRRGRLIDQTHPLPVLQHRALLPVIPSEKMPPESSKKCKRTAASTWEDFDIGIAEGGARTHDLEVDLFAVIRATRSTD